MGSRAGLTVCRPTVAKKDKADRLEPFHNPTVIENDGRLYGWLFGEFAVLRLPVENSMRDEAQ